MNQLFRWAAAKRATYWYVSPFYSQTKRIVWDDPEMITKYLPPGWKRNNNELTITAPNGSIIYFLGADKPDSLRGPNPYGVVFDEFDDIKMEIWTDVVRPVLAMNKGWAWFLGTPKGQGNLFQFSNRTDEDWASFFLDGEMSGLFASEELAKLKNELPQATYNQEIRCQFIAGGSSVFKRINENIDYDNWVIDSERRYKLGVDIAKLNDWTVITPVDLHSFIVGPIERFNQVDYPLIEAKIETNWMRYNKAVVTIDATGVGEPTCDHLERKGIGLERFVFTENTKMQLLENLAVMLERGKIKLPPDEQLHKELSAMRYELSGETKKKLKITSPITDDCVMSLALAVYGFIDPLPLFKKQTHSRVRSKTNPFH